MLIHVHVHTLQRVQYNFRLPIRCSTCRHNNYFVSIILVGQNLVYICSQKELQKLRSTHREEEKSQRKSEVCDDKVVVMLERTEVELFEAKSQLKVKVSAS